MVKNNNQKNSEQEVLFKRFPDIGPCEIENWKEFLSKSRKRFDSCWNSKKQLAYKETLSDFVQVSLLGSGSFGNVILVKNKVDENYYAMKAVEKEKIIKHRQLEHVKSEKKILRCIDFPLIVYLVCYFKDNSLVYIVMPFVAGGELFSHLRKVEKLNEDQAKFFSSQVILAIEFLHYLDLVYRDLKPENILIDQTGFVKVADFGFCKRLTRERTYTLCGTPEYLAPEVILSKGYGKSVDWWAIGVLIYEMVAGMSPFCANNDLRIYEKIVASKYRCPHYFSEEIKDLLSNILQVDVSRRYGNLKNGVDDIKEHRWFKTTNWLAMVSRKVDAPWKPEYRNPGDLVNFEHDNSEWTPPKIAKTNQYEKEFADF